MIGQEETVQPIVGTPLGDAQYAAIQQLGDPSYYLEIERVSPKWEEHPTEFDNSATLSTLFAAIGTENYLHRAYVTAAGDLYAERLPYETDGDDNEWGTPTLIDTGVSLVGPRFNFVPSYYSGSQLRLYYYKSGSIVHKYTGDEGGNWYGPHATTFTVANVTMFDLFDMDDDSDGLTDELVRIVALTESGTTRRLRVVNYKNSTYGGLNYALDVYFPYPVTGLAATAAPWNYYLYDLTPVYAYLSTDIAPYLSLRADGDTTIPIAYRRQGIVGHAIAQNSFPHAGTMFPVDVLDYSSDDQYRIYPRVTYLNGLYFMVAYGADAGRRADGIHTARVRCYASANMRDWSIGQPVPEFGTDSDAGSLGMCLARPQNGDYTYLVDRRYTVRCKTPALFGEPTADNVIADVTDKVLAVNCSAGDMRQSKLVLDDQDGALYDGVLGEPGLARVRLYAGVLVSGEPARTLVSTEYVDDAAVKKVAAARMVSITSRGPLSLLRRTRSPNALQLMDHIVGADNFRDLGRVAIDRGTWSLGTSPDSIVVTPSSNYESSIIRTTMLPSTTSEFFARVGFKLPSGGSGVFTAGFVFNYKDLDDCFVVTYANDPSHVYAYDDDILLTRRLGGTPTYTVLQANLTWARNTWYYLAIMVKSGVLYVWQSTDNITFTLVNTAVLTPQSACLAGPEDVISTQPVLSGYVGLDAYSHNSGYSTLFRDFYVCDLAHPLTVESAISKLAAYGGVVSTNFRSQLCICTWDSDDGSLADFGGETDDDDGGTWEISSHSSLYGTGDGSAVGTIYYSTPLPWPDYVLEFDALMDSYSLRVQLSRLTDGAYSDHIAVTYDAGALSIIRDSNGAGISIPVSLATRPHFAIQVKWEKLSPGSPREEEWIHVSVWVDGVFIAHHPFRMVGYYTTTPPTERFGPKLGGHIGFGVLASDEVYYYNIRVAQLSAMVPYVAVDPGGDVLAAIGQTFVEGDNVLLYERFDGGVSAVRVDQRVADVEYAADDVYEFSAQRDRYPVTHARLLGSAQEIDVMDNDAVVDGASYQFAELTALTVPELSMIDKDWLDASVEKILYLLKEQSESAGMKLVANPLLEVGDRISIDGYGDWTISGLRRTIKLAEQSLDVDAGLYDARRDDDVDLSAYAIVLAAGTSCMNLGNDSSIKGMAAGADGMTIDFWAKLPSGGQDEDYAPLLREGTTSAAIRLIVWNNGLGKYGIIIYGGNTISTYTSSAYGDDEWHHVAYTYDDGGDRKARIWIDGVLACTPSSALTGSVLTSAGTELKIGNTGGGQAADIEIAWLRFSNAIRWSSTFTPPSRTEKPALDNDTIEIWAMQDGSGTAVKAARRRANDAALTDITWETM